MITPRTNNTYSLFLVTTLLYFQTKRAFADCGAPLTSKYLEGIKSSKANNFVPSVYYNGQSTKFITAEEGETTIESPFLCVDYGIDSSQIQLYDDGTHGDDVANDGVFTRDCVHFCTSVVDFSDLYGFAYHQNIYNNLIVMDPAKKGTVPYQELLTPLIPNAKTYASSHLLFFADVNRLYYPNLFDDENSASPNNFAKPTGKSIGVSALLQVFGDVFDYVTMTPLEGNMGGGGIYKWQNWDRRGGAQPFAPIGKIETCAIALTGVPVYRLAGVITTPPVVVDWEAQVHELIHGMAGYEFNNVLDKARTGDGGHVPGSCTIDHSAMQGPVWDWVKGAPIGIPRLGDALSNLDLGVFIEPNAECDTCPDDDLANCCSFRYLNQAVNKAELMSNKDLNTLSPMMLYISGIMSYEDLPANKKTYYCMGSDTDGGCGTQEPEQTPCVIPVDDTDPSNVKSTYVSRFTLDELITANGGKRYPAKKFNVIRNGAVYVSTREPTEAEITFYTLIWRQFETYDEPWERTNNHHGDARYPMSSWNFQTSGKSRLHTRLHGIDCGAAGSSVPSCGTGSEDVCAGAPCGPGAICQNFDGQPLCICREGLIGDGYECAFSSETDHQFSPTAHEIVSQEKEFKCFVEGNVWPSFVNENLLPSYPGGQSPFAPTSCFDKGVCPVGWRCHVDKGCIRPTSKKICENKGFNRGQCDAMGCCKFVNGICKKRKKKICPRRKIPNNNVLKCEDQDTCCYFACSALELDKETRDQFDQVGNCGKDCTVGVLADVNGVKHPQLYISKDDYYINEKGYGYDDINGPLYVSNSMNMHDRCFNQCVASVDDLKSKFLLKIKSNSGKLVTKKCKWLQNLNNVKRKKICIKNNLSTQGYKHAAEVCKGTCGPVPDPTKAPVPDPTKAPVTVPPTSAPSSAEDKQYTTATGTCEGLTPENTWQDMNGAEDCQAAHIAIAGEEPSQVNDLSGGDDADYYNAPCGCTYHKNFDQITFWGVEGSGCNTTNTCLNFRDDTNSDVYCYCKQAATTGSKF